MWCQARRELLWQNIDGVCGPRPRPGRHAERERPGRFGERVSTDYAKQGRRRERIEDPVSVNDIRRGRTAGLDSGKLKHPHPATAFNHGGRCANLEPRVRPARPAAHARALAASAGPPASGRVPPRIGRRQRPGKNVGRCPVIPVTLRVLSATADARRS